MKETIMIDGNGKPVEPSNESFISKITYSEVTADTITDKVSILKDELDEKLKNLEESQTELISSSIKNVTKDTVDAIENLDDKLSVDINHLKTNIVYNENSIKILKEYYNSAMEFITDLDNKYAKLKRTVNALVCIIGTWTLLAIICLLSYI